jgi:heme O synthase-like polyprenyltransferase
MVRTCQRPLVQGVNPYYALGVGVVTGTLGMAGMFYYNPLTAAIGAAIWISYLGIYTRMKTQS